MFGTSCFPIAAFKSIFDFGQFNYNVCWCEFLRFISFGINLCFLELCISFITLGKFSANISSCTFLPLSLFPTIIQMPICLMLFQTSFKLSSCFSICCSNWVISTVSSRSLICSSASSNLLFVPSSIFFISAVVFLHSDWFFYIFSMSLFMFSVYSSILLLSLMGIFMTVILDSLSEGLLISIWLSSFPEVSFSFVWNIFLCLLILSNSLCMFLGIR